MKKVFIIIAVTAAFYACNKNSANDMTLKNEERMRTFTNEVINKHNPAMIDSLVSPDYVEHVADPNYPPTREGLKENMEDFFKGYPDIKSKINFLVADSDKVMMQYTITGTNTGYMLGMPPTGKKINIDGVDIVRYKDGKAVEHWGYMEEMKMMAQLGIIPGMESDTSKPKITSDTAKKM